MTQATAEYHQRRAIQERAAADAATSTFAAACHREMATLHDEKAAAANALPVKTLAKDRKAFALDAADAG